METKSFKSPKNRYSVEINYDKPLKELGSVVSFTANTIEECRELAAMQAEHYPSMVVIRENKKTYPEFDWVVVEKYNLNK